MRAIDKLSAFSGTMNDELNNEKSEIPISKFETISKSQIQMFETTSVLGSPRHHDRFEFCVLVIRICFGFRISDFEFVLFIIPRSLLFQVDD
jgi:hypothetical protein